MGIRVKLATLQQIGKLPKTKELPKYHSESMARTSAILLKKEETFPIGQCHHVNPDPRAAVSPPVT